MKKKKKLRIGLLMDEFKIPAWAYTMLERIMGSGYGEIILIVLNANSQKKQGGLTKFNFNWRNLIYLSYLSYVTKKHKYMPNAFEIKDTKVLLSQIPKHEVRPRQTKLGSWFKNDDVEKIQKYEIDVLIQLGFRRLKGEILSAAKFGVWTYQHVNNELNTGVVGGFWEVLEQEPLTESLLEIFYKDLDRGKVIYRSYSSTDEFSVIANSNKQYWKSLSFIPRKLDELHNIGGKSFLEKIDSGNQQNNYNSYCLYRSPTNIEIIKKLAKHLIRNIKGKIYKQLHLEQWILLYNLNNGASNCFHNYKQMIPPKDRIWADPHVVYKNGKYYIFIEESLIRPKKGHISLIIMDENGHYEKPKKIIEKPYHLSYPFVFQWEGEYYMIPETSQNKTIEIYKCIKFPDKWKFQKNLMENIVAADTTLFYYQKRWWLFANINENDRKRNWDELFLFYSDSPLSDTWQSHPQNPIMSDSRKARPGGKIFWRNGNIYRPSQNCLYRYGYGLKINQILKLNETEYEETEVDSIEPTWDKNIKAVHSFNNEKNLDVIDVIFSRHRYFNG